MSDTIAFIGVDLVPPVMPTGNLGDCHAQNMAAMTAVRYVSRLGNHSTALKLTHHRQRATISIGVTARRSDDTADSMLARVDAALYRAKREGRNCVRVAGEPAELSAATSVVLVAAE